MRPAAKFNSIVTTATTFVMWVAFIRLLPALQALNAHTGLVAALITIVSSVAIYRGFAALLIWALDKYIPLKSYVFGPYFMHGTWVGHFKGSGGELRYLVEHFEQDIHSLVIRGRSYFANGAVHANWTSEAATVDAERGRLIYTYSCDTIQRGVTLQGVAVFQIERSESTAAATKIDGYAANLVDGVRCVSSEQKHSSSFVPFDSALQSARQFADRAHSVS